MDLPFPGVGIVFDIDALGGGFYGASAWRIFMKHLQPSRLIGCVLMEGDTNATLGGLSREFCIAVYGVRLDMDYVKRTFSEIDEKGLCPKDRRFIEKPQLDTEPLCKVGEVDGFGRLAQDSWTRVFHDRCKDTGWGYSPRSIPDRLPPEILTELKKLMAQK